MRTKLLIALLLTQFVVIALALGAIIQDKQDKKQETTTKISHSFCDEVVAKIDTSKVKRTNGSPSKPDFSTMPDAALFKTVISNAVAEGPNFAGRYRFIGWGCGTNCMDYAIVNVETGKIIKFGFDNPSPAFVENFSLDSNLLVFNSKESVKDFVGKSKQKILEENDWFYQNINQPRLYYQMVDDGTYEYLNLVCGEHILDGVALEE